MVRTTVTQREIAKRLGISRGTVDRALHNRARINPDTKKRVIEAAAAVGYYPNRIAQHLATGRSLDFEVITPSDPFWESVKMGAESFLSELGAKIINVRWYRTNVHDTEHEVRLLRQILERGADGIAIVPADSDVLRPWIDRAVAMQIPVVTINSDAPESRRVSYVGQDPQLAGRVAADLLGKFLMQRGEVSIVTAFRNVRVHALRVSAFQKELLESYPGVVVREIVESHDSPAETYQLARRILGAGRERLGIYLTTGVGTAELGRALKESGHAGTVPVVCFDFQEPTVALLRAGIISAAIGQDPHMQGYQSMKLLYDSLLGDNRAVERAYFTRTDIGMKHTVDPLLRTARLSDVKVKGGDSRKESPTV